MSNKSDDKHVGSLEDAQNAIDQATRLREMSRAGKLESEFVDAVNASTKVKDSSDGLTMLMDGVNTLVESLPPLVRALDAVAQIHPFLAIAVGAFKVVVELEAKRRDNDKKVNLLFLEMRNMMATLLQLQDVRTEHVARDGLSIGSRLDALIKKTAEDIKACANACDAYARKRLLVKVFKAPSWDGTLKEYIQLFGDRKGEFSFAIAVHTGLGLDRANTTLDTLVTKMDLILEFFEKTVPDEQRALAEVVRQAGGAHAVLANADVMRALLAKEQQLECLGIPAPAEYGTGGPAAPYTAAAAMGGGAAWTRPARGGLYFTRAAENQRTRRRAGTRRERYVPRRGSVYVDGFPGTREDSEVEGDAEEADPDLQSLMRDLADEPAVAIRRNFVSFERKFRIQQREIVHEMTRVVVHEGDRVISSVLAGPHERIIDPDMYEIWKDMRWRGIVKARHLALAIHDYYSQKLDDQQRAEAQKTPVPQRVIDRDDLWALECLDLMRLQQITEAFDSDASGFVTVQEVNAFTTSRPKGWSLLHWLAYWAVGWQVAMTTYRRKIRALLARMRAPAFRAAIRGRDHAVQQYLDEVIPLVDRMTQPFREDTERLFLAARFEGYVAREEVRLREGLETARYELDALDTLALVNGPMRLERNLFVILYLVLRRHCDIMKVGRRVILHPDELADAAGVVRLVKDAFDYRVADLAGLFTQRRLMVTLELSDYASGMMAPYGVISINYGADEDDLVGVAMDNIQSGRTGDPEDDCSETVLKYPPHFEEFYPENEDVVESKGTEAVQDLQALVGHWVGIQITEESGGILHRRTFSLDFHPAPGDPKKVIAVPLLSAPWVCTRATVTGTFTGVDEEGRPTYALVETFNTSALPDGHTKMTLGVDGTLTGERDNFHIRFDTLSNTRPQVVMKKGIPLDTMQFYPQLPELHANKPAALWRFAISATLHDVRRRRFSWSFLQERRGRKRRLASLLCADANFIAESDGDGLHSNDRAELVRLANKTTPADWHFFAWASVEPSRFTWVLPWCAECRRVLKTVRPCLRCSCTELWIRRPGRVGAQSPGVALCNRAKCLKRHVEYGDHSVIKTRTEGWKLDAFFKEKGLDSQKLARTGRRAVRAITAEQASRKNVRRSRRSSESFGSALHSLYMSSEASEDEDARSGGPERDGLSSDNSAGSDDEWARTRSSKQSSPDEGAVVPLFLPIGIPGVGDDPDSTLPPQPKCTGCSEEVKFPCWLCIECSEPTYICYKCGGRDREADCNGSHTPEHVLLMLRAPDVSGPPSTSRIRRLRSRSPPLRAPRSLRLPAPPVAVLAGPPPAGFNDWPQPLGRMVREESEDSQGTVSEGRLGRVEERMDGFESRMEGVESQLTRIDGMLTAMMGLLQGHKP